MYYVVLGCFWSYLVEVLDALVNLNVERIKGRFLEVVGAITTPPTFKTPSWELADRNPPGVYQVFLRPDVLNHISVLKHRCIEYIHYIFSGQDYGDDENVKN